MKRDGLQTTPSSSKMKRKLITILFSTVLVAAFWFLGVDSSWFLEDCPECLFGKSIYQIRVFTIPIYEQTKDYDTILSKIAADLGVQCKHPKLTRVHWHRNWGLLICAHPCINGTWRMSADDSWYDDKAKAIVREMARENPSLRVEIAERVVKKHDWEYWKPFLERVKTLRGVKPDAKE